MTMTPHIGLHIAAIEAAVEETLKEEEQGKKQANPTTDPLSFTAPTLPDPIFWETVAKMGMPKLRHSVDLHVNVYRPETQTRRGKHAAPENLV